MSDLSRSNDNQTMAADPAADKAPLMELAPSFSGAMAASVCHDGDVCFLTGEPSVYALVPAAGAGTRMGGDINKPFLELDGIPAIVRTLRILAACPCIAGIMVMARHEEVAVMKGLLAPEFSHRIIDIAAGGATRQASVAIGLLRLADWLAKRSGGTVVNHMDSAVTDRTAIDALDPLVAIHDGARCLVTQAVICRTLRHAAAIAPCAAAVPVKDTIKAADPTGRVEQTLDRSRLYAIQTPQVARLSAYLAAFRAAEASGFVATDDLSVLEAAGVAVDLVPGDEHNLKLTTPWDLMIARALLSAGKG